VHNFRVDLCTRHNCADARTQLLAMSRTAKMRARPTHLTKGSNPHREVWTHPLANCTLLGACVASIFVKVVVKGPARKASREERTMDKRQALSRSLLKTSLLSPILTLPLSSPTLLSIHLSLYLVSHDHPSTTPPHSLERHLINLPLSPIYHHRRVFPTSRRDKLHQFIQHHYYYHHLTILHSALRIDCSKFVTF
jgi:hypothetical protein